MFGQVLADADGAKNLEERVLMHKGIALGANEHHTFYDSKSCTICQTKIRIHWIRRQVKSTSTEHVACVIGRTELAKDPVGYGALRRELEKAGLRTALAEADLVVELEHSLDAGHQKRSVDHHTGRAHVVLDEILHEKVKDHEREHENADGVRPPAGRLSKA